MTTESSKPKISDEQNLINVMAQYGVKPTGWHEIDLWNVINLPYIGKRKQATVNLNKVAVLRNNMKIRTIND